MVMGTLFTLAGLAWWFFRDVKWFMDWNAQVASIAAEGRYTALPPLHEAALRSRRPAVLLIRKVLVPGQLEAQYALHLHMAGANGHALDVVDAVLPSMEGKGKLLSTVLAIRAMALSGLGRLDEAEADFQKLMAIPDTPAGLKVSGVNVSLLRGRLEEALARARAVLAEDPRDEAAHLLSSVALLGLGRADEAMKETEYDVRSLAETQDPVDVKRLEADEQGRQVLEAQERERAQVTRPSPLLQAANIWLEQEDPNAAMVYVERARPIVGQNPGIVTNFHFIRATALAMKGEAAAADAAMVDAETAASAIPEHRTVHVDLQLAHARVDISLGRGERAIQRLDELLATPLAPLMKHHALYWRARALTALGRPSEAVGAWRTLMEDGIQSVFHERARRALAA